MASFRHAVSLISKITKPQGLSSVRFYASGGKKEGGAADKCQKLPSSVPPPSSQGQCNKVKAAGCASRARENCNPLFKNRTPCEKLEAPFASYSECLKDPPPPERMSECPRADNGPPEHCRTPKEGLSIDGCSPPGPKELGACKPRKRAPPRSNDCDPNRDGCDHSIKPFKNASSSSPSPISCPSQSMMSRISEPVSLGSPFSTPKRFYSSNKDSNDKPPKRIKTDDASLDWLKSKSPNECKKKQGKCDPTIKPYKNKVAPPEQLARFHSAPIITRVACSKDLIMPCTPLRRYYHSAKNASKKAEPEKPCFEPKKIKPKEGFTEEELSSRLSCVKRPDEVVGNRCERAKCGPFSIDCPKPPPINQHKCPKKPVVVRMRKKKVTIVPAPKILLGYKVCDKPQFAKPYQCKPKIEYAVVKTAAQLATPKRCPCFTPMDFNEQLGSTCRKMPNAVEPDCNKPSANDGQPKGVCKKKEGC